jgi:hypothetical protein
MDNEMSKAIKEKTTIMPEPDRAEGKLKVLGGSNIDDFNNVLANDVIRSLWYGSDGKQDPDRKIQSALATLVSLKPENELEGMLLGQMIACNHAAMECFRRAMIPNQSDVGRQQNLSFAGKLSRTYALHMETLDKHRGKGQQKVTVEHVHVHQGGQAIVGNVQTGAGVQPKKEEQPDAKTVTHAPESEMRSAFEAVGETVPQRRDEER